MQRGLGHPLVWSSRYHDILAPPPPDQRVAHGGLGRTRGRDLLAMIERVSQLYEQGVDLLHIGAYVRRWLRWARSGLKTLGAGLSERALELVVRDLVRLGLLGGSLPPTLPAMAGPTVGDEGDGTEHRYKGG